MDRKLVGWALGVKARQRRRGEAGLPPLWLFTDRVRMPDPMRAIGRLPPGLAGVVLRDAAGGSAAWVRRVAGLCRRRHLALCIGGDAGANLGPGVGMHLRAGHRRVGPRPAFLTSSAHDAADVRRALRAGAAVVFLSPVFPTLSHPGRAALGVARWSALACDGRIGALGGIDGHSVRRLPVWCRHIGAVGALSG